MRMPGYPSGVPSQYAVHYHPWPTRFHGPLYQRPEFRFPWQPSPQNVLMPWQRAGFGGLGEDSGGVMSALFVLGLAAGAAFVGYKIGFEAGIEHAFTKLGAR